MRVEYRRKDTGESYVVEIPDERDWAAVADWISRRLNPDQLPPAHDPKFDAIILARAQKAAAEQKPVHTTHEALGLVTRGVVTSATPAAPGVRDTSMAAYRKIEASGKLTEQQRRIYDWFAAHPGTQYTRSEVADGLKMRINSCTGRINEMIQEPFAVLEECGRRRCRVTGETANELRLKC